MKAGVLAVDDTRAEEIEAQFRAHIADRAFPCVGAKSAAARNLLEVVVAHDMRSGWDDLRIHDRLIEWAERYRNDPEGLRSMAVVFEQPGSLDESVRVWEVASGDELGRLEEKADATTFVNIDLYNQAMAALR